MPVETAVSDISNNVRKSPTIDAKGTSFATNLRLNLTTIIRNSTTFDDLQARAHVSDNKNTSARFGDNTTSTRFGDHRTSAHASKK